MLRGLSGWFGMSQTGEEEKPPLLEGEAAVGPEKEVPGGDAAVGSPEQVELQVDLNPLLNQAKGFGSECLPPFPPPQRTAPNGPRPLASKTAVCLPQVTSKLRGPQYLKFISFPHPSPLRHCNSQHIYLRVSLLRSSSECRRNPLTVWKLR